MDEAGLFDGETRIELIDGEVVEITPIGFPHQSVVDRLNRLFTARLGERAIVRVQGPAAISNWSLPQPDVLLLAPRADFYRSAHPQPPHDIQLLVEVSGSTVRYDRIVKVPLYARGGVSEVWVVDLPTRVVHVSRQPGPDGYEWSADYSPGQSIKPVAYPDLSFGVDEILG